MKNILLKLLDIFFKSLILLILASILFVLISFIVYMTKYIYLQHFFDDDSRIRYIIESTNERDAVSLIIIRLSTFLLALIISYKLAWNLDPTSRR